MTRGPLLGLAQLARFRAAGLAAFDATPAGVLNALAPWIAFAIVGAAFALLAEPLPSALAGLLGSVVALLTPVVASHALAQAWRREGGWLRYCVAMLWCQWLFPPALLAAGLGGGVLLALGLPQQAAELLAGAALLAYAVALQVFVARHALGLGAGRAGVLVVAVNLATLLLAFGPTLLATGLAA